MMRTKLPLTVLSLSTAAAAGFSTPDPLIPKKQSKDPNNNLSNSHSFQHGARSEPEKISDKDRVINDCNKKRAYSMQWLFRKSTSSILHVDWSSIKKEIDPKLVQRFTDDNMISPKYYSRVLIHGLDPLSEEQAQAEEPSMSVLSITLADRVSLYDLSMQILQEQNFIDVIGSSPSTGLRVVDIGCGTGTLTKKLLATHADRIEHVDAIDASPYKLAKFFSSVKPDDLSKVRFHHMLGENLTALENNSTDRVVISFVFHEMPQGVCRKILSEAWRVLSPSGTIHIVDMDNKNPRIKNLSSTSVDNWLMEPYMDSYLNMDIQAVLTRLNFVDVSRVALESPAPIAGFAARKPGALNSG